MGNQKSDQYFVLPHTDKKQLRYGTKGQERVQSLQTFQRNYVCLMESAYLDMFEDKGAVYIFPLYANMILKIDVKSRAITQEFGNTFLMLFMTVNIEKISDAMYLCAKEREQQYLCVCII